ncbi:MAG: bifunctional 5,10-methylenetetrahydrofolate dehydrogenase/5,10-methenyltetrahydrofolate cyclohydrolase [Minisyncoccia bacterium]
MIVEGKEIAARILAATRSKVAAFGRPPIVRAVTVSPTAATESYLRIKSARALDAGMHLEVVRFENSATTEEVIFAVEKPGADAVIVQLPLPSSIDKNRVLEAIPLQKDADVLSFAAKNAFETGAPRALLPPVVAAVKRILAEASVDPVSIRHAVVLGQGELVGKPIAIWLGIQTKVTSVARELPREELLTLLKDADLIVSGIGVPHFITPEMISPGVVLIDAGTSESDGTIVGDADPRCKEIAKVFTPVPGGVGPVAVACLFKNVQELLTAKNGI